MGRKMVNRIMYLIYGYNYGALHEKPTRKALAIFASCSEMDDYFKLVKSNYDYCTYAEIVEYIDFFGNKTTKEKAEIYLN